MRKPTHSTTRRRREQAWDERPPFPFPPRARRGGACGGRPRTRRGRNHDQGRLDQPLHRAATFGGGARHFPDRPGGAYRPSLPAHRGRMPCRRPHDHRPRRRGRRADPPFPPPAAGNGNLDRRLGRRSRRARLPAVHGDLRPQCLDDHHDRVRGRAAARHPEDDRGPLDDPQGARRCGQELQPDRHPAILEDPVSRRAADDLRRRAARIDLRADQHRRRRVPHQFRRTRPANQRPCRTIRPRRHLCGDLLRCPGKRRFLHDAGAHRAMAATDRLTANARHEPHAASVTLLRAAMILALLALWEFLSHTGWFYRDVVPSLLAIGRAVLALLSRENYYYNLGVTAGEVAAALAIGGGTGLAVGLVLGSNRFLARAFEPYLYYLGPTPKIIFFPVMIMWFGVDSPSKVALGSLSCFFPVALSVAAGMRQIDTVLIRVGRSFRASALQMVTKIYLPAMRHPIMNGVRLGLGVALIGTLLAETKLSNKGIGFLIINAYSTFDMPRMYANLIVLFVLAIGANSLIGRLGGAATAARR